MQNKGIAATTRQIATSTTAVEVYPALANRSIARINNDSGVNMRVMFGAVDASATVGEVIPAGATLSTVALAASRITIALESGTGTAWATP